MLIGTNYLYETTSSNMGDKIRLLNGNILAGKPAPAAEVGKVTAMVYGGYEPGKNRRTKPGF